MHYDYQSLLNDTPHIQKAWLLSFEMGMYLVKISVDGQEGMVFSGDRPLRFSSIEQARQAFEHCEIDHAELVHQSPYDEMIGHKKQQIDAMRIPLQLGQRHAL
ncbi:DUF6482 family protein [Aliiglaciecola sp. CAU 1673]|uniref:DUF6482 family protein n=1 Tax=Aliiglaciecola sp. CAU 1673 TaxID=3032595 RepID=UPI0023DA8766|nr:DUF6482 family protein [Aliiglaciecola sp. CAU 1673]MDF2179682.1 DUF6482 family protein [Aliiglaciecola sp. CAU 1673]